ISFFNGCQSTKEAERASVKFFTSSTNDEGIGGIFSVIRFSGTSNADWALRVCAITKINKNVRFSFMIESWIFYESIKNTGIRNCQYGFLLKMLIQFHISPSLSGGINVCYS
ncbi:MAG TPA: hypothetical protein PK816_13105, partial [Candidatus Cloacimonadota bacterium]|nr:hypothetical protein [Candidatus Cloacimonadota bacterium]